MKSAIQDADSRAHLSPHGLFRSWEHQLYRQKYFTADNRRCIFLAVGLSTKVRSQRGANPCAMDGVGPATKAGYVDILLKYRKAVWGPYCVSGIRLDRQT